MFSSVAFTRKVEDRKKNIDRIEKIAKSTKIPTDSKGMIKPTAIKKQVAKENADMLFNLLWGKKLKQEEQ